FAKAGIAFEAVPTGQLAECRIHCGRVAVGRLKSPPQYTQARSAMSAPTWLFHHSGEFRRRGWNIPVLRVVIGQKETFMRLPRLSLIPLLAVLLYGQTTDPLELIKRAPPTANQRIAYGDDNQQFGELRLPAGNVPFPVAVLIHGGCWSVKLGKMP